MKSKHGITYALSATKHPSKNSIYVAPDPNPVRGMRLRVHKDEDNLVEGATPP